MTWLRFLRFFFFLTSFSSSLTWAKGELAQPALRTKAARTPTLPPTPDPTLTSTLPPEIEVGVEAEAEVEVEKPDPVRPTLSVSVNQLQQQMTSRVFTLSNRLDSFFGTARADDQANLSTLRLVHSNYFSETGIQSNDFQARLNLRLKNVEDFGLRLQESILRFFEPEVFKEGPQIPGAPVTGVNRARQELIKWNVNWENRVGVTTTLNLFSILRARRSIDGDFFMHNFYQEVGWSNHEDWQAVTSLGSDKAIDATHLFRFINEIRWAMTAQKFTTSHGPSLLQTLDESNSISYDARASTAEAEHIWYGETLGVGVNYRRQFQNKWLFMDISPQMTFPRATNFHRDLNLTIRIEAAMGNL
jgi:hypothetical protein